MALNLYISSLPEGSTTKDVKDLFSKFGVCGKVNVRKKAGLLYGFVELKDGNIDLLALENLQLRGSKIKVELANSDKSSTAVQEPVQVEEKHVVQEEEEPKQKKVKKDHKEEKLKSSKKQDVDEIQKSVEKEKKKVSFQRDEEKVKKEKKIRKTEVADVAKSTAWDEVIGHKWEEGKSGPSFSIMNILGKEESSNDRETHFELAATKYFMKDVSNELLKKQIPTKLSKSFEEKLDSLNAGNALVEADLSKKTLDVDGSGFVRNEEEIKEILSGWSEQRALLRKDFKKKKYRARKK